MRDRRLGAWGIGTLSSKSPAYNLIGYYTGSVWSQENALTALEWRSLPRIESALEVAQGLFYMTLLQPYEPPPELFGGYERNSQSDRSVQYFSTAANDVEFSIIRYPKILIDYPFYHIIIA